MFITVVTNKKFPLDTGTNGTVTSGSVHNITHITCNITHIHLFNVTKSTVCYIEYTDIYRCLNMH